MVCCLALEVGREKALASAGHMTTKHPEFVGVLNWHTITYDKQQEKSALGTRLLLYTVYCGDVFAECISVSWSLSQL